MLTFAFAARANDLYKVIRDFDLYANATGVRPRGGLTQGPDGTTRCRYRVQSMNEANGVWSELRLDLIGTGSEVEWIDDGTAIGQVPGLAGRRFYRIRIAT